MVQNQRTLNFIDSNSIVERTLNNGLSGNISFENTVNPGFTISVYDGEFKDDSKNLKSALKNIFNAVYLVGLVFFLSKLIS